jgi:hypothetical protein
MMNSRKQSLERAIVNHRGTLFPLVANLQRSIGLITVSAIFVAALAMVPAAAARPQDTALTVQLTSPVSVASAHRGDAITGQITSPDAFKGDTIQGKVTQTNTARGQAVLQFTFDSLAHSGMDVPLTANIQGVANSKGQPGLDDQGRTLLTSNVAAKAPAPAKRSRFGSQLGGLIGGTAGEIASDASEDTSTTSGSPAAMQVAAQGPDFQLAVGAMFTVTARSNGGTSLASLTPNASASAASTSAPPPSAPS